MNSKIQSTLILVCLTASYAFACKGTSYDVCAASKTETVEGCIKFWDTAKVKSCGDLPPEQNGGSSCVANGKAACTQTGIERCGAFGGGPITASRPEVDVTTASGTCYGSPSGA